MDTHELKNKAVAYIKKEKFEKAIEIYKMLQGRAPDDTSLMLKLGNLYETIGQERSAIDAYSRASEIYYQQQRYQQGIAVCRLILKADPLDILAQKRLVDMYIKNYGGLPKKRGDTIIPPAFVQQASADTADIAELVSEPSVPDMPAANAARDSWHPVDVVFSDSDVETETQRQAEATRPSQISVSNIAPFEPIPSFPTDQLPTISLLAPLAPSQLQELIDDCPVYYVPADEFILREGEMGDALFIILEGAVSVHKGDVMEPVAYLGAGSCFGEMALFGPQSRRTSVIAIDTTVVMEISTKTAAALQRQFPKIADSLKDYLHQQLLNNLLMTCSLFSPFSEAQRETLKQQFILRAFSRDATIFQCEDPVNELFMVVEGIAEMYLQLPGGQLELIRTMGIGEIFGEEPLLTEKPSKVTVRAKEPLVTLCLPRERFTSVIMAHPKIVSTVSQLLGTIPPPPLDSTK